MHQIRPLYNGRDILVLRKRCTKRFSHLNRRNICTGIISDGSLSQPPSRNGSWDGIECLCACTSGCSCCSTHFVFCVVVHVLSRRVPWQWVGHVRGSSRSRLFRRLDLHLSHPAWSSSMARPYHTPFPCICSRRWDRLVHRVRVSYRPNAHLFHGLISCSRRVLGMCKIVTFAYRSMTFILHRTASNGLGVIGGNTTNFVGLAGCKPEGAHYRTGRGLL
jgi:hypothetical protein